MELVWLPRAQRELQNIFEYYAREAGEAVGSKLVLRIVRSVFLRRTVGGALVSGNSDLHGGNAGVSSARGLPGQQTPGFHELANELADRP